LPDAKNPFTAWEKFLDDIQKQLNALKVPNLQAPFVAPPSSGVVPNFVPPTNVYPANPLQPGDPGFVGPLVPKTNVPQEDPMISYNPRTGLNYNPNASGSGVTQNFVTTINNPVGNGIVDMVQQAILDASRLGHNLVPAGSL
jgi:hypothetical protein